MDDKVCDSKAKEDLSFDKEDEYQRKPVAEKVIRLLTSDIDVSPMVIDGGWGAGKTRFCSKLITLFRESHANYRIIYVDAFRADHADEPLLTLLAAVLEHLPETEQAPIIVKAVPAVRFFGKVALKATSGWLLKQSGDDVADGWEKAVARSSEQAIDHAVESLLKDHIESGKHIETLRQALSDLADENPIVIFVDELDRCRPDFAVNMLESIKHVFDVRGVQFVLITNTDQLRASINHRYGAAVDAQRYLDKFVGFSFVLPETVGPHVYRPTLASEQHFQQLATKSSLLNGGNLNSSGIMEFAQELVKVNRLSLREVATWIRYMEIYHVVTNEQGMAPSRNFGGSLLKVFATFLFSFCPDIRRQILRGWYDASEIIPRLGINKIKTLEGERYPDQSEVLAALFAFESDDVPEHLLIKEEDQVKAWSEHINGCFRGSFILRGRERYIETIPPIFRAMQLGGTQ